MRVSVYILLFLLAHSAAAQSSTHYYQQTLKLDSGVNYFNHHTAFSSLKINTPLDLHFQLKNEVSEYSIHTSSMVHEEFPENFVVLNSPTHSIEITSTRNTVVNLELFYAPLINVSNRSDYKNKNDSCSKPLSIDQSEWRQGLPDPSLGRTATTVKHCVIHHAASSNANTDYTAVVRNIYLLHTQSNGWDDIGYNYLIAPNGDVYDGREDQNIADEDNIQGAHFCGKNSGTMGICLIGDYTQTAPSDAMIGALVDLLSWKLHKENIQAFDSFRHPNNTSDFLPSIAMHRLGCSTLCPGDSVAIKINEIRTDVAEQMQNCTLSAAIDHIKAMKVKIAPNPSKGLVTLLNLKEEVSYELLDITMQKIDWGILNKDQNQLRINTSGLYILYLKSKNGQLSVEKLLIH